jgi:hypothetical protein
LTANRSKPVLFAVQKRASTWEKKIWGRKRHLLVDTQGHLLAVKVNAASTSDLQGAKAMLEPAKEVFPDLKRVWGDSRDARDVVGMGKRASGLGSGNRARTGQHPGASTWFPTLRLPGSSQTMGH